VFLKVKLLWLPIKSDSLAEESSKIEFSTELSKNAADLAEKFLNLLERNFQDLVPFFVPSTTIFNTYGTLYGNSEFNRHRFVYKPGINDGSEFKVELPLVVEEDINVVNFSVKLSEKVNPTINTAQFTVKKSPNIQGEINSSTFIVKPKKSTQLNTNLASINSNVFEEEIQDYPVPPILNLTPIIYPE
jgi:hypothetical protein